MRVLIAGGTGFVGKELVSFLHQKGNEQILLGRKNSNFPEFVQAITDLEHIPDSQKIDGIINLAGAPISKRWTQAYKDELVQSRLTVTRSLVQFVRSRKQKPKFFLNASAIGYYGSQGTEPLDETSQPHQDFTHDLCRLWEEEAQKIEEEGVRLCLIRLGIVLGKGGGALSKMLPAFCCGLGGRIGSGQQIMSWIHIKDVVRAFEFLIDNEKLSGVFNLTAPHSTSNAEFTKTLGHTLKRPTFFPMPSWMVKTLFGEMGEALLLKGQNVIPKRLQEAGFQFEFPSLDKALSNIL